MTNSHEWLDVVLAILDDHIRGAAGDRRLSWKTLTEASGVSRQTLWRNEVVRNRYGKAKLAINDRKLLAASSAKSRRKILEEQVTSLRRDLKRERSLNEALYSHFLSALWELERAGIDPRRIFGDFNPRDRARPPSLAEGPRR